jgi:predicted metal-dependent HD superfamily phosphohydrolase
MKDFPQEIEEEILDDIFTRYAEDWRVYHNSDHLLHVLNELDQYPDEKPPEVLMALLYHDSVYIPLRHDNEIKSAELARRSLTKYKFLDIERIVDAIMATEHRHQTHGEINSLVCDIDLSPLGKETTEFEKDSLNIEQEYGIKGDEKKEHHRSNILLKFLSFPKIFLNDYFFEKYEKQTTKNLQLEIDRLIKY